MLRPDSRSDRINYGASLLPPAGMKLVCAVGTTFSLDLTALIGVAVSLGLAGETVKDSSQFEQLAALQRVSRKVLVFCEADQIKLPGTPSRMLHLLEKMVIPIALPAQGGIFPAFHAKTWLLQYIDAEGNILFRAAVLSRNLTLDTSWDICATVDGKPGQAPSGKVQPLLDFFEAIERQIPVRDPDRNRKKKLLSSLLKATSSAEFRIGDDAGQEFFSDFDFIPLGLQSLHGGQPENNIPFLFQTSRSDARFSELAVFSPFLSKSFLAKLNEPERLHGCGRPKEIHRWLISRPDSLAGLDGHCASNFKKFTLKEVAAFPDIENDGKVMDHLWLPHEIHAKMFVVNADDPDHPGAEFYLGSANATESACCRNVEMMLHLKAAERKHREKFTVTSFLKDILCGVLDENGNPPPESPFEVWDPMFAGRPEDTEDKDAQELLRRACHLNLSARATPLQGGPSWSLTVQIQSGSARNPDQALTIQPIFSSDEKTLEDGVYFEGLHEADVSEFFKLTAHTASGKGISRLILIPISGMPDAQNREGYAFRELIKSEDDFWRYLDCLLDKHAFERINQAGNPTASGAPMRQSGRSKSSFYETLMSLRVSSPEKILEICDACESLGKNCPVPEKLLPLLSLFRASAAKGSHRKKSSLGEPHAAG